jgi:hypothetical protein
MLERVSNWLSKPNEDEPILKKKFKRLGETPQGSLPAIVRGLKASYQSYITHEKEVYNLLVDGVGFKSPYQREITL